MSKLCCTEARGFLEQQEDTHRWGAAILRTQGLHEFQLGSRPHRREIRAELLNSHRRQRQSRFTVLLCSLLGSTLLCNLFCHVPREQRRCTLAYC
jgi:hypothetical protein